MPQSEFQLMVVREAYELFAMGKGYPGSPTLEFWTERIVRSFRKGAQIYVDNPKYKKKALGEQIISELKDVDSAVIAKKYKGKVEKERSIKRNLRNSGRVV